MACVEAITQQEVGVHSAFNATNQYELGEAELYLRGGAAEIYLVLDNP